MLITKILKGSVLVILSNKCCHVNFAALSVLFVYCFLFFLCSCDVTQSSNRITYCWNCGTVKSLQCFTGIISMFGGRIMIYSIHKVFMKT